MTARGCRRSRPGWPGTGWPAAPRSVRAYRRRPAGTLDRLREGWETTDGLRPLRGGPRPVSAAARAATGAPEPVAAGGALGRRPRGIVPRKGILAGGRLAARPQFPGHQRFNLVRVGEELVRPAAAPRPRGSSDDAVVRPEDFRRRLWDLSVSAPPAQRGPDGERPRRVDLSAERAQDTHTPVAHLVDVPLYDDRAVVWDRPRGLRLVARYCRRFAAARSSKSCASRRSRIASVREVSGPCG